MKIEIMSIVFSHHNDMKLEIKYKKKTEKHKHTLRLKNTLLNNKWVNNTIKSYLETNKHEHTITKSL